MILHLFLTNHWYDEHASGRKNHEYRVCSAHWCRIIGQHKNDITEVALHRAYTSQVLHKKVISITELPNGINTDLHTEVSVYDIKTEEPDVRK